MAATIIMIPAPGIPTIIPKRELPKTKNTTITTKTIIATVNVIESNRPNSQNEESPVPKLLA